MNIKNVTIYFKLWRKYMAYIDSINNDSTDYAINSFANLLTASGSASDVKTVTFPNGYDVTEGSTMTFRVLFPNGHTGQSNMTLNGKVVVVNKYGTLIPLPYHNISSTYKSLQPNTVLEMYYTSNYDGNNTPAFVIVGNPIVLSSNNYIIYADGKNVTDTIYPVGSLYWSSKSTNPSSLFGGTWVQIKDKFVLACGDTYTSSGATGGASSVTLSVSNMPSHNHSFTPSGTVSSHTHGLNNHTHSFSVSGTTGGMSANATGNFQSIIRGVNITATAASSESPSLVDNNKTWTTGFFSKGSSYSSYASKFYTPDHVNANSDPASIHIDVSHTHSFSYSGTTGGNSKNTASATPTFSGSAGTTSSNGSGTSFSILPPYVVKYCWERTA